MPFAKVMSLFIHRLCLVSFGQTFSSQRKGVDYMKAMFSARVGWLGAVLSLLTFLSGKKVSVFFCELFFPKRKVETIP